MQEIPINTYDSVDENLIMYLYKREDVMERTLLVLLQGGLKDVKKYMSIDDVMATANALFDFKKLPYQTQTEIVENSSVCEIINYAYGMKKGQNNYFSEVRANRADGMKPTEIKECIKSKQKLTDNQKKYYESEMMNKYEKISLEDRMNELTEDEIQNFKTILLKPTKKIASSKEFDFYGSTPGFSEKYVVINQIKTEYAKNIANELNQTIYENQKRREEEKLHIQKSKEVFNNLNIPENQRDNYDWQKFDNGEPL
jgi:ribosomal protein S13